MSRFLIAFSLFASLTSTAAADFAKPPAGAPAVAIAPRLPRRMVDADAVRAKLVAARAANLARFRAYQAKGSFPSNTYTGNRLNVWRDEQGHFCAAATIIRASGQVALVDRVADQTNFIRLADVKQGPLMDWILTSGFTQDEIAMIQEPMEPVTVDPEPQNGIVDARMRAAENRRLVAKYRAIDATLVKGEKSSLDTAVARLMAHPDLAQSFLDG